MGKYKWDYKELKNNILLLKDELSKTNDTKRQDIINSIISIYNYMILELCPNGDYIKNLDDSLSYDDINDLIFDFSKFYTSESIKVLNIILPAFEVINDRLKNRSFINYKMACNNEQYINNVKIFFKSMTPKYVYEKVEDIFSNNKTFLNITHTKDLKRFPAITISDEILNKKYINVCRTNGFIDFSTLPHEMFHFMFGNINISTIEGNQMLLLSELEGMFSEILYGYYNCLYGNLDKSFFKDYYLKGIHLELEELLIRNTILNATVDNNSIRMHKFNKELNYHGIKSFNNLEDTKDFLVADQVTNVTYILSYLTALDLFYIYKNDPHMAFYLLENLCSTKDTNDLINTLRCNHITFMDDDYKNLKKYLIS